MDVPSDTTHPMRSLMQPVTQEPPSPSPDGCVQRGPFLRQRIGCILYWALLGIVFAKPLLALAQYALDSDLYSYVVLVPLTSIYLLWLRRNELLRGGSGYAFAIALIPALTGPAPLATYWVMGSRGWKLNENDDLSITTFAFVGFVIAGAVC